LTFEKITASLSNLISSARLALN